MLAEKTDTAILKPHNVIYPSVTSELVSEPSNHCLWIVVCFV
jgi:hypothetical protein